MIDRSIPETDPVLKAATSALVNAANAAPLKDELFGPELSRLMSVCASAAKEHESFSKRAIIQAIEQSGRFQVMRDVCVPITAVADALVATNALEALAPIRLRFDAPAIHNVWFDFVLVDMHCRWAGGYQVRSGNTNLDIQTRRQMERHFAAARLMMGSVLEDQGYNSVEVVTIGIIDLLGGMGLPECLIVRGSELEQYFGVSVISTVERMTAHLRSELDRLASNLLRGRLSKVGDQDTFPDRLQQETTEEGVESELIEPPNFLSDQLVDLPAHSMRPFSRHPWPKFAGSRPSRRPANDPLF